VQGLSLQVTAPQREFPSDEPLKLQVILSNTAKQTLLIYDFGVKQHDFTFRDAARDIIWRFVDCSGAPPPAAPPPVSALAAGNKSKESYTFEGEDKKSFRFVKHGDRPTLASGKSHLPPGTYEVTAEMQSGEGHSVRIFDLATKRLVDRASIAAPTKTWTGRIASQPLRIVIAEPSK
jgi:hypothetical protein